MPRATDPPQLDPRILAADPRWEAFAAAEPYFAVLTAPRFKQAELTPLFVDRGLELLPGSELRAWRDAQGRPWISGPEAIRERSGRAPWRSR